MEHTEFNVDAAQQEPVSAVDAVKVPAPTNHDAGTIFNAFGFAKNRKKKNKNIMNFN